MSDEQMAAFQAGSSAKPGDVSLVLLGLLSAALFLWAAWCLVSLYRGFSTNTLTLRQLGGTVARLFLLILVSFWLVLS